MKSEARAWPPSLSEFIGLVRHQRRPEHQRYVALPRPAADPGTVALALQVMRQALR
jgi:hypothetical protein